MQLVLYWYYHIRKGRWLPVVFFIGVIAIAIIAAVVTAAVTSTVSGILDGEIAEDEDE